MRFSLIDSSSKGFCARFCLSTSQKAGETLQCSHAKAKEKKTNKNKNVLSAYRRNIYSLSPISCRTWFSLWYGLGNICSIRRLLRNSLCGSRSSNRLSKRRQIDNGRDKLCFQPLRQQIRRGRRNVGGLMPLCQLLS